MTDQIHESEQTFGGRRFVGGSDGFTRRFVRSGGLAPTLLLSAGLAYGIVAGELAILQLVLLAAVLLWEPIVESVEAYRQSARGVVLGQRRLEFTKYVLGVLPVRISLPLDELLLREFDYRRRGRLYTILEICLFTDASRPLVRFGDGEANEGTIFALPRFAEFRTTILDRVQSRDPRARGPSRAGRPLGVRGPPDATRARLILALFYLFLVAGATFIIVVGATDIVRIAGLFMLVMLASVALTKGRIDMALLSVTQEPSAGTEA